jgi:SNF2 family DNA or RNA helicase
MLDRSELKPYQHKAINFFKAKKRCAWFLDMGLGKTISALTTFVDLKGVKVKKCLIIAPLTVANTTWSDEIAKWTHTKDLTYAICTGTEKQRLEGFKSDVDIYITNQDNVNWALCNGFNKFGMIILDESSGFKSYASQRFKALKKFISNYFVCLTGTPAPNGYIDLWSQIYLLDGGARLGKNITFYRNAFFNYNAYTRKYICKNPDEIMRRISDICLTLKAEDYLIMPDKISYETRITISNKELYKEFENEFYINIEKDTLVANNAAVLAGKLLQFCNGAIYDKNKKIVEIHNDKIEVLRGIIEDNPCENIIVAYNYQSDLLRLKKAFSNAVLLDDEGNNYKLWKEGKIKLLLCNPASKSKGLNLQHGGRMIIWFGLTWNLEHYKQFNARLYRQGQNKPVIINHIIAKGCMDEKVLKGLSIKDVTQEKLLNYLKSI